MPLAISIKASRMISSVGSVASSFATSFAASEDWQPRTIRALIAAAALLEAEGAPPGESFDSSEGAPMLLNLSFNSSTTRWAILGPTPLARVIAL